MRNQVANYVSGRFRVVISDEEDEYVGVFTQNEKHVYFTVGNTSEEVFKKIEAFIYSLLEHTVRTYTAMVREIKAFKQIGLENEFHSVCLTYENLFMLRGMIRARKVSS